jgi:hemerythrin-like metal-binding protein
MLVSLVHTLESHPGNPQAGDRIMQIADAITEHFLTEEVYLEGLGYPDLSAHRHEHEALVEIFREKLTRWHAPGAPPIAELVKEVAATSWQHIETVDWAYAVWLKEKQVACARMETQRGPSQADP